MATRTKLKKLDHLFNKGSTFQLTNSQYEKLIGENLPKEKWYLENRSAVATVAKEHGYQLKMIVDKTIEFIKND